MNPYSVPIRNKGFLIYIQIMNRIHMVSLIAIMVFTNAVSQKFAVTDKLYGDLRSAFDSDKAYQTVAFAEKRWRLAGNPHFDECIFYIENILRNAGFINEQVARTSDVLTYRIEKRKLRRPSWQPMEGSLTLTGDQAPLLSFDSNKNMIAINSASTGKEGVTGEIINIGSGTDREISGKNLSGKILFGIGSVRSLHAIVLKHKALGLLTYSIPPYNQPEKHTSSISFGSIPYLDSIENKWCIFLSYAAKERLATALAAGAVHATVKIKTAFYTDDELTIIANVKGSVKQQERFVFSAHVQEPGANDNASGVGALAEMARVTAEMIKAKKYLPHRSITFLWGDEIISTRRYIVEDSLRKKGILWGLSLDMVGEDVNKTGGSFLIEKMPDPSAIWTRGKDKHTEWGGSPLKESDLFPHYFNDMLLNRCLQQSKFNGWKVNTNPFEGGSDHTPFLDAHIPGLLMWHFTDVFYHVDGDRIDMVSKEELENVGVAALATAFTLCANTEKTSIRLIHELKQNALSRIKDEINLSKSAIAGGAVTPEQYHIIDVWKKYYTEVFRTMIEINTEGPTPGIRRTIEKSIDEINKLRLD